MRRALELSWADHGEVECLHIRGWDADELARLRTHAAELVAVLPAEAAAVAAPGGLQPIAGVFFVDGGGLCFRPRFPFRAGLRYVLRVASPGGSWRASTAESWELARPDASCSPGTVVASIHPRSSVVPLNLLKFYIEFSAPMSEGFASTAITLRREDGSVIDDAFGPMAPELWDPGRRRLTVLLDPGRIKRGLVPHEEQGYPLVEGQQVTLRIDTTFHDARGAKLAGPTERTFEVGPAIRQRVVPGAWECAIPRPRTRAPFTVRFARPLDHALLARCISIVDDAGLAVVGNSEPCDADNGWQFLPERPWRRGLYALAVDPRLEDLAGNSVRRLFDHDVTSDTAAEPGASTVWWRLE